MTGEWCMMFMIVLATLEETYLPTPNLRRVLCIKHLVVTHLWCTGAASTGELTIVNLTAISVGIDCSR